MAEIRQGKWVQRSEHEWRSLLSRFAPSGLGVKAFCRREAISAASFYRWQGLLSDDPRKSLNEHWFTSMRHAQVVIEAWRREYNEERPKKSLGGLTPAAYAKPLIQKSVKLTPDSKAHCY